MVDNKQLSCPVQDKPISLSCPVDKKSSIYQTLFPTQNNVKAQIESNEYNASANDAYFDQNISSDQDAKLSTKRALSTIPKVTFLISISEISDIYEVKL